MSLDSARMVFKPFEYPWAFAAWRQQHLTHWLPDEAPMGDDVRDWNFRLTAGERNLLTHIFRFFTQSDIEVQDCYASKYAQIFKPTEIKMMLAAFSDMETVHIAAYAHILETLNMPDSTFSAFLDYEEMKAKHEFTEGFNVDNPYEVAKTLAVFGGMIEGLMLFASFAILMNFPRHNKMKGMGQIITWSVRDETLHCDNIIRLYHAWRQEKADYIDGAKLDIDLSQTLLQVVALEHKFVDLAFEMGDITGLCKDDVKVYINYVAKIRAHQLKIPDPFPEVIENPLPWLQQLLTGHEHSNFFEQPSTEYSKSATAGSWGDVY